MGLLLDEDSVSPPVESDALRQPTNQNRRPGGVFALVHSWIARIPRGRVATYGQLSELVDRRVTPVGVGWALRATFPGLPWHRVVNSQGGLSTDKHQPGRQRALLAAEGVAFRSDGTLDLERYQWRPRLKSKKGG
jgi:methylated-DNA-protein-cysteine methyltransferase related protein